MAYIAPSTEIRFLSNVPLNSDYENTFFFQTELAQSNYFISKTKYTLYQNSYQRETLGTIRASIAAENLITCNYLMFRNINFGNKWFYAFLDKVEYINNSVSRVYYTIDELQTWHFDYTIHDCFVERNHTTTDDFQRVSLTPEPVQIGEYVDNNIDKILNDRWAVIVATVDVDEVDVAPVNVVDPLIITTGGVKPSVRATRGHLYQNVYSGLTYCVFDPSINVPGSDQSYIDYYIGEIIKEGKSDSIVGLYVVPRDCFATIPDNGLYLADGQVTVDLGKITNGITTIGQNADTIDGYLPKNKKLYSYPYNYMEISNGSGGSIALRYEFFIDYNNPQLSVKSNIQLPVTLICEPINYNRSGSTINPEENHDFQLVLGDFPQCSWNVDTYSAWAAQNSINLATNLYGVAGQGIAQIPSGPIAAISNLASAGIGFLISQALQANRALKSPDQLKGSTNSGSGAIAQGRQNFFIKRKSMNRQFAKIADDYFTMFGYAVNEIKKPNDEIRNHRPHFTYIKTIGCDIVGELPSESIAKISSIFDNGCRFWNNPAEIGDFSLDNSPT